MIQKAGELWREKEERVLRASGAHPANLLAFPSPDGTVGAGKVRTGQHQLPSPVSSTRLLSTTPPDLSGAGRVGLAKRGGAEAAVRGQAGMLPTPPPPASNGLASVNGEEAKHQRG